MDNEDNRTMVEGQECTAVIQNTPKQPRKYPNVSKVKIWDGEEPLPVGRVTELTKDKASSLFAHIIGGGTIRSWCRETGESVGTVYTWINGNEGFRDGVARARSDGAHSLVEQGVDAIKDNSLDLYWNGKVTAVNTAQVQRDYRLAGIYQWLAGKFNPMYADQTGAQVNVQVNTVIDAPSSEHRDEWVKRKALESAK